MTRSQDEMTLCRREARQMLLSAMSLGVPHILNVEWLIDRAERGEWSGLWW